MLPANIILIACIFYTRNVMANQIFDSIQERNCNNKIKRVTKIYFKSRACVTILKINTEKSQYNEVYKNIPQPKVVSKIYKNNYASKICFEDNSSFLLFVANLEILYKHIFQTKRNPFMSPIIKFLIYTEKAETLQDIEEFLRNIWEAYRTPHILIINNNCTIYHFNPFAYNQILWGSLKTYNYKEIARNPNLIENNLNNLNGYPIKTIVFSSLMAVKMYENDSYVQYGGIDGTFLTMLSKQMNFTKMVVPNIRESDYGYKLTNGHFCGALRYVLDKKIEFISVSYFVKDYETHNIEFSSIAMTDELCVVVRKGSKIHNWELSFIYSKIWLLLLTSFIIISTIWLVILSCETSLTGRNNHRFCVFSNTFRLMLANPFPRRTIIFSERVFLISCMLAMMTFLVYFQGYLVKFFTAPIRKADIKTLAELADTDFKIYTGFYSLKRDVFGDDGNPIIQKLKKRVEVANRAIKIGNFRDSVIKGRGSEFMRKCELDLNHESR